MTNKSRSIKKISCIIPAFNEEKHIGAVLDIMLEAKQILPLEIIVVDDGSTDQTPKILSKYKNIRVVTNKPNKGKSYSVARGFEASEGDYILMADSDLFGLTVDNISELVLPVQQGVADTAMSIRRNFTRRDKIELLTGERMFPRSLIHDHIDEIKKLPNFALEVFLNNLVIKHHYTIKAVDWDNVVNTNKTKKRGFYSGWKANFSAARDIFSYISARELFRQYIAMRRLMIDDSLE